MLQFVLRCYRVPVGKVVRHAIRHHWNVGHHTARVIYHGGIVTGTMLVCVAVPVALWALPPSEMAPPREIVAPPPEIAAPPPEAIVPPGGSTSFVPGLSFSPPREEITGFTPQKVRVPSDIPPSSERVTTVSPPQDVLLSVTSVSSTRPIVRGLPVSEPASILTFAVGVVALLLLHRRSR